MADTSIQREVEDWIRQKWLPSKFGQEFGKKKTKLSTEGFFEFDAVNNDETIVVNISTSGVSTSRGKRGTGKLQKIRADIYFLLLLPDTVKMRILLLTEPDMVELCQKEQINGRIPRNIEINFVDLPDNIRQQLQDSKQKASDEMTPPSPFPK